MRIGILTYHFSENFGALMQAYGLRQWLVEQGHEAEFINYHPRHVEEGGDFEGLFDPARLRRNAKVAYLKLSALQRKLFGNKRQAEQFERFRREVLGVNGARLETQEAVEAFLSTPAGQFDMVVCGSDQIWNPSPQRGLDPVYFLGMKGIGDARRVAYAPSFGRATLDPAHDDTVRGYLAAMDGLSVREASGVEIVRRITGRQPALVPDPTILLGDFSGILAQVEPVGEGHVFCYALRTGDGIRRVAEMVSRETGGTILSPYNVHRRWREIGTTVYPSPAGWVAMIDSARFVVTNSFHGTVLSILLRKPFLAVALPGKRGELNERVRNLLTQLDLMGRFIDDGEQAAVNGKIAEPIDWHGTHRKLAELRASGVEYLTRELARART